MEVEEEELKEGLSILKLRHFTFIFYFPWSSYHTWTFFSHVHKTNF